ncbi:hypothetical protein PSTT_09332 [Puccinia striiformis]|uniref:Uncharacterized protein n=1 Tax=Puccinia striiformis TaxID=27350 RepID=A0A2S4V8X3_9BASI|nr:hypothetical protein PSTT_09332 [Puccinia striiformis]
MEDIENFDEGEGADLLEECIKQIHLTSEGSNLRHLLCTKYGIDIHLFEVFDSSDHLFPNWGDDYSALLVAVGSSDWSLVA